MARSMASVTSYRKDTDVDGMISIDMVERVQPRYKESCTNVEVMDDVQCLRSVVTSE